MNITSEMIQALAALRNNVRSDETSETVAQAIVVLDNAGIFAAIDSATGYDITPAPERVSKCTCPVLERKYGGHHPGCPGDAAEWGDLAYTTR